jgi:hypothetical protein
MNGRDLAPNPRASARKSPDASQKMNDRRHRIARAINSFVENPVTNLVKGVILLLIGLSEASRTVFEDLAQKRLRVGHGLIIIGLFGILDSLPHFIGGLEAGKRYIDLRDEKARPEPGPGAEAEWGDDRAD